MKENNLVNLSTVYPLSNEYVAKFTDYINRNVLIKDEATIKTTADGAYPLPKALAELADKIMTEHNVFRKFGTVFTMPAATGDFFDNCPSEVMSWSSDWTSFFVDNPLEKKFNIDVKRLVVVTHINEEYANNKYMNVALYVATRVARLLAQMEEFGFIHGNGEGNQPFGILNDEGGAEIGVTVNGDISYADMVDLYFSVPNEYRKDAVWLMNDSTAIALRTLKDDAGNYIWNHTNDTILGKPVVVTNNMPPAVAGTKPIAFGDLSFFKVCLRSPIYIKNLREIFTFKDEIGFKGSELIDGRLMRLDAVKVIKMADNTAPSV